MKRLLSLCIFVLSFCNVSIAQYFFVFRAIPMGNGSKAGHVFVSFVNKNELKKQTQIEATWGFHSVNGSIKSLYSEKGEIQVTEIGDLGKTDFVVETDYITYEYCKKLREVWDTKQYGAVGTNKNCVDFVKEIVKKVTPELNIPSAIYLFPKPFLDHLRALNFKIDRDSRESLSAVSKSLSREENYKSNLSSLEKTTNLPVETTSFVCQNSSMKWISFNKITDDLKMELVKMEIYDDLLSLKNNGCEAAVAKTDIDNNGKWGFAIGIISGSRNCCGTLGCQFEVRESDGKSLFYLESDMCRVKVGNGGILTSKNKLIKLDNLIAPKKETINSGQLLGGSTPEELGIILLRALKNNDQKTWTRCVHPDREEKDKLNNIQGFSRVRDRLEEQGLTNWSLIKFSRVTFNRNDNRYERDGSKSANGFKIEFTYKNEEFVGQIWFWGIATLKEPSNWYIWGRPEMNNTGLLRNTIKR